jgi:hypothetical protein
MPNQGPQINHPATGVQDNATAILRGHVCVVNSVTDGTKVVRATADGQAGAHYIALSDSPGQNKAFPMGKSGDIVWGKCDGVVTQNDRLMSGSNGGVKTATAAAACLGVALETGANNDLIAVQMSLHKG